MSRIIICCNLKNTRYWISKVRVKKNTPWPSIQSMYFPVKSNSNLFDLVDSKPKKREKNRKIVIKISWTLSKILIPNRFAMIFLLYSAANSISPLPKQYCGKIRKTSFKIIPMSFSSWSSKFSKTATVIVVIIPS